jgi:hypothetical protein
MEPPLVSVGRWGDARGGKREVTGVTGVTVSLGGGGVGRALWFIKGDIKGEVTWLSPKQVLYRRRYSGHLPPVISHVAQWASVTTCALRSHSERCWDVSSACGRLLRNNRVTTV